MTEARVRELCKENGRTWEQFNDWIAGQTAGLNPDGTLNYYDWDVERFLARRPVVD